MKKLFIPFLFLNFLIAEEKVHLSIDKITKNYSVNNNLSGLIELKNHNDTSSNRFALSKDYPVVLNTYKAPVASIIKQVRFYVYEKTGVGVLKMFYLNSDTIAIDSVSMNFSDLNTGESANDILVKDRLWNLEKDESFFISYEVDWDNSSSDASLKYFLDKGDYDTTNTKYWPPRTHIWDAERNKWDYLSAANNFIGSVGLSDLKVSFNEDDSTTFKLELDGLEPGDNPVYTILEADSNITVSINDDEVSIRPNRDWNGTADLTIKAEADSRTASKKFSIIVIPVNDVPQEFEWTSSSSDSINISQSNIADAYTLSWSKSADADEKDSGSSLSFDGFDDYATAPSIELLNSVFTLEAWYKSDGVGDNGEVNIVSNYGTGSSSAVSWNLMIQGSSDSSPGVARFFAAGGSGIDGTTRIDDNVWHHIAFVRYSDGSANLFVDGELENTGTVAMNYNIDSGNNLLIGSRHYNRFTDCKISELMISKTARYSSNFVPPNNLATDTNALIHYKFDEGTGNSLTDYSGNNNSGTINGASWNTDSPSSITYVIHAKIGAYSSEDIVHTSETTYPILYEDILEGAFANVIGNAATVRFTVWAHDGIDSVQATGEDRLLFVNRYDYLLTESEGIPDEFALHENYPNPFNPSTQIRFDLPEISNVTLTIYNLLGQKVKTFNMQSTQAGYHALNWNATNDLGAPVSAGVYLYQLQTEGFIKTKKMILLK